MAEIDENSLEFARQFKPKLRFDIGSVVYLKSDIKKKCPMVISNFSIFDDDSDYMCEWATSQKDINCRSFLDKVLCNE